MKISLRPNTDGRIYDPVLKKSPLPSGKKVRDGGVFSEALTNSLPSSVYLGHNLKDHADGLDFRPFPADTDNYYPAYRFPIPNL